MFISSCPAADVKSELGATRRFDVQNSALSQRFSNSTVPAKLIASSYSRAWS
jgi:hypothetical protein